MRRLADLFAPVLLLAPLLGLWEWLCHALKVQPFLLPPPSAIAAAVVDRWPILLQSAWNTMAMAVAALAAASAVAIAVGLSVALSRTAERALRPIAVTLQVTPIVAIAPLFVIWFGLDHAMRAVVSLAAIAAFFPIFSGLLTGLASADADLERLFDLYEASPLARLWKLRLPSALPFVLEGHKVAAGAAVIGSVVAEWVAGSGQTQGLAWRILEAANRLRTAEMFAALLVLALLALVLNGAVALLEKQLLRRWSGRAR